MQYNRNIKDEINYSATSDITEKYRHVFSNYTNFNKIQTKIIDTILHTDESVVISSLMESEKTVVFELAIIRFLETLEKSSNNIEDSKIIYVTSMKTCYELYKDWNNKFTIHGLKCVDTTGHTDMCDDFYLINSYHLIITTPEKLDSLIKKNKEFKLFLCMIKLFLIDEVHLINEGCRGAILETIISRMKIITKHNTLNNFTFRFVAVSAIISNIDDIAKWLSNDQNHMVHYFKNNEEETLVKLQKIVLGYIYKFGGYKFDLYLTHKLKLLVTQYSNGRPTLIFCSTRKSVEYTCNILVKDIKNNLTVEKQMDINDFLKEINSNKVKALIQFGVGCYHSGMSFKERIAVENLFRIGYLKILVTTYMLGVNIRAYLVIIKSTEYYSFNNYKEYNERQILQMIGRAGITQFDKSAIAIIMTKHSMKCWYEQILMGNQIAESHLHKYLIEYLNTEICLGTIYDMATAMDWIRSTFFFVRVYKSPQNYELNNKHNVSQIQDLLQNLCLTKIKILACTGLINFFNENNKISSKPEGEIMAKYSISFVTIKLFMHLKGTENLGEMIKVLSYSKEFEHIKLRKTEVEKLNILNRNRFSNVGVIRFPIEEGINTRETKINCLLQAILGTLKITDNSLVQDANKIILISIRLTKALKEITFISSKFEIARTACILAKCVSTRLWEQSKFVSKLIPKVGPVLSSNFVLNGKTTLQSIQDTDPRDLERFLNRKPPFGNYIHDFVRQIPKYKVYVSFDEHLELIIINISLIDNNNISNISKDVHFHTVSIIIGDSENRLLKVQQIRNEEFLNPKGVVNITASLKNKYFSCKRDYIVFVCLISDQWVGNDIEIKFNPNNCEEHSKESLSENSNINKSPLKMLLSSQTMKIQISSEVKKMKTEKTQTNIKTYLHNNSLKDQDPKVINKLQLKEDKYTMKCCTNESSITTQKNISEMIETQINSQNNRNLYIYFKDDKEYYNNYFYYDELINDNVFNNLFVPDDNLCVISNELNSSIDENSVRGSINQTKYFKNKIQPKTIESVKFNSNKNRFLTKKFEKNKSITNNQVYDRIRNLELNESNDIVCLNINQFSRDLLNNKQNINPYKTDQIRKRLPFGILQEKFESKHLKKRSMLPTNRTSMDKSHLIDDIFSNKIKTNSNLLLPRTSSQKNLFNNSIYYTSKTTISSRTYFPPTNSDFISSTATGRLSRRIEHNLKAFSNFYVSQNEKNFSETIHDCFEEIPIPKDNNGAKLDYFPKKMVSHQNNNKTVLNKYFRITKTSRQCQNLCIKNIVKAEENNSKKSPDFDYNKV